MLNIVTIRRIQICFLVKTLIHTFLTKSGFRFPEKSSIKSFRSPRVSGFYIWFMEWQSPWSWGNKRTGGKNATCWLVLVDVVSRMTWCIHTVVSKQYVIGLCKMRPTVSGWFVFSGPEVPMQGNIPDNHVILLTSKGVIYCPSCRQQEKALFFHHLGSFCPAIHLHVLPSFLLNNKNTIFCLYQM